MDRNDSTDGFNRVDATDLISKEVKTLNFRQWIEKLNHLYSNSKTVKSKNKRDEDLLKSVIKNSIPLLLRPYAYMVFSGGFIHLKRSYEDPEYKADFRALSKKYEEVKGGFDDYREIKRTNPSEVSKEHQIVYEALIQIDKDLGRTYFPQTLKILAWKEEGEEMDHLEEIEQLEGEIEHLQAVVREVLICYVLLKPEVGYVQGMNSIVSQLAYQFFLCEKIEKNEDLQDHQDIANLAKLRDFCDLKMRRDARELFYIFLGLMEFYRLERCFGVGMEYLMERIDLFELYFKKELPELHERMCGNGVKKFQKIKIFQFFC